MPPVQRSPGGWLRTDLATASPPARRTAIATMVAISAAAVIAGAVYVLLVGPHWAAFDLKIYDHAIRYWAAGHSMYDYWQPDPVNGPLGFTYPPLAGLLMSPMAILPLPAVITITEIAIVGCSVACGWLVLAERVRMPWPQMLTISIVLTAVMLIPQPVRQTIMLGQINMFLALLVLGDLLFLARRGSGLTGIGVGLAMAVKITPGIFLLYFLLARRWKAAGVAVATAAIATGVSAAIAPGDTWRYFTELLWQFSRVGVPSYTSNQSLNGLLARLADPAPPSRAVWIVLSLLVVAVGSWRARRALRAGDRLAALTVIGFVSLLVSPVSWLHHAVWLTPAAVIIGFRLAELWKAPRTDRSARRERAGLLALSVTGIIVWSLDLRPLFHLPATDFSHTGVWIDLVASVITLWMVVALLTLPIRSQCAPAAMSVLAVPSVPAVRSVGPAAHPSPPAEHHDGDDAERRHQ